MSNVTPAKAVTCPRCNAGLVKTDIPRHKIWKCSECSEVCQELGDGRVIPLGEFLEKNAWGDDRARAAVSKPHIVDMDSFNDAFENAIAQLQMDLYSSLGSFRTIQRQIENRLALALNRFSGLDMVSDEAQEGLAALRQAQELISSAGRHHRGIDKDADDSE